MRALVATRAGGPEVLEWQEVPAPTPGPGQVLLRPFATAVNWSDVLEREGRYPGGPQHPFVAQHDVVAEVVALGAGVTRLGVGERVYGCLPDAGGGADLAVCPATWMHRAPPSLSTIEAAAAPSPFLTAQAALQTMGSFEPGDSVLVHAAAGGFGSAVVQLCRHYGASTIIGTAGGPAKLEPVRSFGADVAVDYLSENFVDVVREVTGGRGVDLVVDSVGGDVLADSFDCVTKTGKLMCIGATEGKSTRRMRLQTLFDLDIWVGGFTLGNWIRHRPDLMDEIAASVFDLLESGAVRVVIGGVFPAEEAAAAHQFLMDRKSIGRTVIELAPR